jgi:hypothetical protein
LTASCACAACNAHKTATNIPTHNLPLAIDPIHSSVTLRRAPCFCSLPILLPSTRHPKQIKRANAILAIRALAIKSVLEKLWLVSRHGHFVTCL